MIRKIYLAMILLWGVFAGAYAQINFNSSASFKYLKGSNAAALPVNWMTSSYNPSDWANGIMPFRSGVGTGGTLLNDMQNNYSSLYMLSSFTARNISQLKDVIFSVNFNDGFIVWINGEEVFSVNAPTSVTYQSEATSQNDYGTSHTYRLQAHDISLKEGENLIAIQGLNASLASPDFYFSMAINAVLPPPQTSDTIKAVFSKPNGFYNSPFDLHLEVPDPSYTLVYTIDGSNPQYSPTAITGGATVTVNVDPSIESGRPKTPCFIVRASLKKGTLAPSFPLTQTYIFLDQVMNQTYPGGAWPQTGTAFGQAIDLDMDPDVTQNPAYAGQMKDALTSIPSISVVTDLEDLFGEMGIYVNAMNYGENWERFSSIELINPSGTPGFNINAGLRIRGGYSRNEIFPKHAFRLFFRGEYGAAKLRYPLFENEGVSEFDKIDLRCEQNYAWTNPGDDKTKNTAVREVFSRDTQREMGWPYTRSRYYHLYLNGMYWGLYQTQERSEARYAADYLGGSKEDYDVIKVDAEQGGYEATDGNTSSWEKIYNLTVKGFANNADYFALEGKDQQGFPKRGGEVIVNLDNLIDYMQLIFYTGNFDAPVSAFMSNQGPNNFYAIDKRDDHSSGFIFFAHDAEHTLMVTPEGPSIGIQENRVTPPGFSLTHPIKFHPQWLHHQLTSNEEYKLRFADRAYKNFYNNGVFTPDVAQARFAKRVAEVSKAIVGESARWGDAFREDNPYSWNDWNNEINDIYNRFFPVRTDIVIEQMKEAGLLPSFNPPVITMNNGQLTKATYPVNGNYQVTLSSAAGQIFYTLDGTDPRMVGGEIRQSATEIATGGVVNLHGTSWIKSRVRNGTQWSALSEVKLLNTSENFDHLKITELHYHPTDSIIDTMIVSGKSFEFIELKNTGDKPISLAGLRFAASIDYQFKETDVLGPHQFYVIASKPKWFYERHYMVPSGNFNKNLSNSGEQVILSNASGSPVIQFTYLDYNPWPQQPDGDGPSLSAAISYPTGDPNDASYWKASSSYDGTPFADDKGIVASMDDPLNDQYNMTVFPNPTSGKLYLKVKEANAFINIEITSLSGSIVYQSSLPGKSEIDLGILNIHPGIYFVKTQYKDHLSVHKVVYHP